MTPGNQRLRLAIDTASVDTASVDTASARSFSAEGDLASTGSLGAGPSVFAISGS